MKSIKSWIVVSVLPLFVVVFTAIGDISLLACRVFAFELEIPEELK